MRISTTRRRSAAAGEAAAGAVILLAVVFATVAGSVAYRSTEGSAEFTVAGKERVSYGAGDTLTHKYLVYTEEGETFEVTDSLAFGRWISSDVYGSLREGRRYRARVAGWRLPFWNGYRNILEAEPAGD